MSNLHSKVLLNFFIGSHFVLMDTLNFFGRHSVLMKLFKKIWSHIILTQLQKESFNYAKMRMRKSFIGFSFALNLKSSNENRKSVWYGLVYRYVRVLRLLTHIADQFIVKSISKGLASSWFGGHAYNPNQPPVTLCGKLQRESQVHNIIF